MVSRWLGMREMPARRVRKGDMCYRLRLVRSILYLGSTLRPASQQYGREEHKQ